MDCTQKNLGLLTDYFQKNCKKEDDPFRLGVEIEHFLMDKKTHRSAVFDGECGVEQLLYRLAPFFDESHFQENRMTELDCSLYNLTLEPSCQFEISIAPEEKLNTIETIYLDFRSLVDPVLSDFGLELLNFGYNPYEKNEDMQLIPKARYAFMDRYFTEIGTKGRHMMRSTASTQVSIDYYSEDDFREKFRSVYVLGPLLALYADNCPVYDGQKNDIHIRRQKIWRDVDAKRVNVFDYMPFDRFGFADYAQFVYNTPLIVGMRNGKPFYTTQTACELYRDKELSDDDIRHLLSMVFPMARLKNYIEIRCADSMPIERSLAFAALIKGLYIEPQKLYNMMNELELETARDTIVSEDAVMKDGLEATVYGFRAGDLLDRMKEIAMQNLGQEERRYLC